MNYTVYKGRESVGELAIEPFGLYYDVVCRVQSREEIQRIYAICGTDSICLGIPDKDGCFARRIPVKHLPKPDRIIASVGQSDSWRPWSGDYFGPMVYDAYLRMDTNGWSIAVALDELENTPQTLQPTLDPSGNSSKLSHTQPDPWRRTWDSVNSSGTI